MDLTSSTAFGGIFATHRNSTTPLVYSFESFSITPAVTTTTNTAPVFSSSSYSFSVPETAAVGSQAGVVAATDAQGQQISYAITAGNGAGKFSINAASGAISVAAPLSYSQAASYSLTITATDNATPALSSSAQVSVNVIQATSVAQEVKVNFQDPATIPPTGWVRDYGQAFGSRTGQYQGSNLIYGWKKRSDNSLLDLSVGGSSNLGNGRNRNRI
jgi:hypothetical protein